MSLARPAQSGNPLTTGPLDRAQAIRVIEEADALIAEGDYAAAAPRYARLVGHRDADLHVAALLGLAEARYRLDDDGGALQAWRSATQAPETTLAWLAWKRLGAALVRAGDLAGARDAYRRAHPLAPRDEQAEIASRLGWLSREVGDERAARRYFQRARAGHLVTPIVTYAILAVTVAIGISEFLSPRSAALLLDLFALDKTLVADGQLYRLVSVVLVHSPNFILHLGSNMYALYLVGPVVEGLYGRGMFLAIYLLTAAAGSTASYVFMPNDSVGASGAIFGLFGVLLVAIRVHKPVLPRQTRALTSQIGVLVAFNLLLGFGLSAFIDNAAHVGGLLAGAWIGLVVRPRGLPTIGGLFRRTESAAGGRQSGAQGALPAGPANAGADRRGTSELVVTGTALVLLAAVLALGVLLGTEARREGSAERSPAGAGAPVEIGDQRRGPVVVTSRSRRAPKRSRTR